MQPNELMKCMKSKNAPILVDVRTGIEFRRGHIPGALHAPTWKILLRLDKIPSDRNAELVITCEHGPRARIAESLLQAYGYRNIALLDGHMAGWRRSGFPLQK
ncbi:rhodanese-like domain-containing protein [Geomonas agri]|uniref:rhodanese-like domain-containing protein n=1 Tax=Geomonas agri TaxID=2873702 RepID=UPI001CD76F91|nr:rhodanese-like domain-containing protein [Geomonas agri]